MKDRMTIKRGMTEYLNRRDHEQTRCWRVFASDGAHLASFDSRRDAIEWMTAMNRTFPDVLVTA